MWCTAFKKHGVLERGGRGNKNEPGEQRQAPHLKGLCTKAFDFIPQVSASPIFPLESLPRKLAHFHKSWVRGQQKLHVWNSAKIPCFIFNTQEICVLLRTIVMFVNMKIIFYICDQWLYRRYIMFILCPCILHDALYFSTHFLVWDHSSRYEEPLKGIKLGSNFIGNSMGNGGEQGTREGDS